MKSRKVQKKSQITQIRKDFLKYLLLISIVRSNPQCSGIELVVELCNFFFLALRTLIKMLSLVIDSISVLEL